MDTITSKAKPRQFRQTEPTPDPGRVTAHMARLNFAASVSKGHVAPVHAARVDPGALQRVKAGKGSPPPAAGPPRSAVSPTRPSPFGATKPGFGGSTAVPLAVRPANARPPPGFGSPGATWGSQLRGAGSDPRGAPLNPKHAAAPTPQYLAATTQPRSDGDAAAVAAAPGGWYDKTMVSPAGTTALPGASSSVTPFEKSAFAVSLPSGGSPGGLGSARPGGGLRAVSASAGITRAAGATPSVLRVTPAGSAGGMYDSFMLSQSIAALPMGRPLRLKTSGSNSPELVAGGTPLAGAPEKPLPPPPFPQSNTVWGRHHGSSRL